MNATYVNAIIRATKGIITNHLGATATLHVPSLGNGSVSSNDISVILGVKGDLSGQIICSFSKDTAKQIVSKMMGGMPIDTLDDMGWSAVQEFGNWIAGTTATELSTEGCIIDVTPPVTNEGLSTFHSSEKYISLVLDSSLGNMHIHLSFQEVDTKIRA